MSFPLALSLPSLFPISFFLFFPSFFLSFCEWMWMGQTNTTFMEMASCALKSNGAAAVREQAGGEKKMRREGSGRKTHTKGKWCRCQKRYLPCSNGVAKTSTPELLSKTCFCLHFTQNADRNKLVADKNKSEVEVSATWMI